MREDYGHLLCHRRTKTDRIHTNSATTIKEHLVLRPMSMKFFYFIVFIIKHKYGEVSKFKKMTRCWGQKSQPKMMGQEY